MMSILAFLLDSLFFGATFWVSVWILSGRDTRNTVALAGVVGLVFGGVASFVPFVLMALPLVALFYLLVRHYDLGLIRSFVVVVFVSIVGLVSQWFLRPLFASSGPQPRRELSAEQCEELWQLERQLDVTVPNKLRPPPTDAEHQEAIDRCTTYDSQRYYVCAKRTLAAKNRVGLMECRLRR